MAVKVLAIGDTANIVYEIKKVLKNTTIHIIDFPSSKAIKKIHDDDYEVFSSNKVKDQFNKINSIKSNFDVWAPA